MPKWSTCSTETVVNELILAVYGEQPDARQRHVLRQALHGLVRQAKMELLQEMRRDMNTLATALNTPKKLIRHPQTGEIVGIAPVGTN